MHQITDHKKCFLFLYDEGVQVKLLEFKGLFGENSDIIVFYVADVLREHNILSKIVAFCGNNTNCNFGGSEKKGKNNVFAKLNQIMGRSLIGIGRVAHVIHNAIKCATDCLPFDIECIIVKIYSFFYIYTVREEALKQFCEAAGTEYQKLLGYSKTRWLALMPAIERVLQLYVPLKKYFLSIKKCPTVLKNFFECPTSELWLFFVHSQSVTFHTAVLRIEGQNISAIEAAKVINELRANLEEKLSSIFLPYSVRRLLSDLQKKGEVQEDYVKSIAWDFYKTTTEYLQQWTSYNQSELQIFKWVDLRKILTWVEVQKSMDVLIEKGLIGSEQDTEVFDEFTLISSYVSDKVEEWNSDSSNKYAEHRWIEVFQYFRDNNLNHTIFQKIVEYVLCMPATNAPVERIFSLMNNLWTAEKTQLQVSINDAIRLEKWMLAINRQGFIPKKSSRICNIHFLKTDFVDSPGGSYKLKLKPNTVPSVFPGRPVASTSIFSESPVHQSDVLNTTPTKKRPLLSSSDDDNKDKSWVWSWTETKMPKATSSPILFTPSKKMRSEISFPVSPKIPASTPTKYKKQIRLLKQKLRRREATIKNMKGLLDNLKNIEPGFLTEVFDALKTLSPADKHCNLILDAMAIRKQIVWDKKNSKYVGFSDYGNELDLEGTNTPATEVLVFMLVSLNGKWKVPVGYVFQNKISASTQAELINSALTISHNVGLKVWGVTCDGAFTNFSSMKILGCSFDNIDNYDDLKCWFDHPVTTEKVFFIPDPCHMVKLARNTLGNNKTLISNDGAVKWSYIDQLFEVQNQLSLKFANKLSQAHVKWQNNKMKVKLAAQTLSASTADALTFLKNMHMDNFHNVDATVIFCRNIDRLFDFLNTRNPFGKGFKSPIFPSNIDFLESVVVPIDHIEILFSRFRQKFGSNNNPNILQFKTALKQILMKNAITCKTNGNCNTFDNDVFGDLLEFKWNRKKENLNDFDEIDEIEDKIDEDIINRMTLLNSSNKTMIKAKENILYYITGYIVKKFCVFIVLWRIVLVANMTSFNANRLRKIFLSESSASIEAKVEMFKERLWVHELNKNRETEGFILFFSKLKKHADNFFEYCRMDEETFN
ncbi:hypothetical protein QTP88_026364 [Uroleucon formosanum]